MLLEVLSIPFVVVCLTLAIRCYCLYLVQLRIAKVKQTTTNGIDSTSNNTCDLEEDEANHRYTIVHYIGKKAALIWWTTALILAFVAIVVAVILGLLSPIMLLILLIAPLMIKFARPYLQKQVKKETFISSVKILMVFQLVQVLLFFVSLIKF